MNKFLEIKLTTQILDISLEKAQRTEIFKGSHRGLQANIIGCIGEVVFEEFLKINNIIFKDQRHGTRFDYLVGERNISIDVKTKDRTVEPRCDFDNSVPLYNHQHQRPQFYFFISLLRNRADNKNNINRFKKAFILGGIDIDTLDAKGIYWKKGETDTSNGTTFWTDCINVKMPQLYSPQEMLQIFNNNNDT